jgi:hypothetical protein
MEHALKTWPEYFQNVLDKKKTFELRKSDRDFKVGDTLLLKEWQPKGYSSVSPSERIGEYTGRELRVKVIYIFNPSHWNMWGISDNVIMSIEHNT